MYVLTESIVTPPAPRLRLLLVGGVSLLHNLDFCIEHFFGFGHPRFLGEVIRNGYEPVFCDPDDRELGEFRFG